MGVICKNFWGFLIQIYKLVGGFECIKKKKMKNSENFV